MGKTEALVGQKGNEGSTTSILQEIILRYKNKALPELPAEAVGSPRGIKITQLWGKPGGEKWRPPAMGDSGLRTTLSSVPASSEDAPDVEFAAVRKKPRRKTTLIPGLTQHPRKANRSAAAAEVCAAPARSGHWNSLSATIFTPPVGAYLAVTRHIALWRSENPWNSTASESVTGGPAQLWYPTKKLAPYPQRVQTRVPFNPSKLFVWPYRVSVKDTVREYFWPDAPPLLDPGNQQVAFHILLRSPTVITATPESAILWGSIADASKPTGSRTVPIGQQSLWPRVESAAPKRGRWTASSQGVSIAGIGLVVTANVGKVPYKRSVAVVAVVTNDLLALQVGGAPTQQPHGRLFEKQAARVFQPRSGQVTAKYNQSTDTAPLPTALIPLVPAVQGSTSPRMMAGSRVNNFSNLQKVHRSIHRVFPPVKVSARKKDPTDKSRPQVWVRSPRANNSWNHPSCGSPARIITHARFLWGEDGKSVRPTSGERSLDACCPQSQLSTNPTEPVDASFRAPPTFTPLRAPIISVNGDFAQSWLISTGGSIPPGASRLHNNNLPHYQPRHPADLALKVSSCKRPNDSPLFLALLPVTASIWTPGSKSNPCPPLQALRTPSLESLAEPGWRSTIKHSPLQSLENPIAPPQRGLFSKRNTSNLVAATSFTEFQRKFHARKDVTIAAMEGPLQTALPTSELPQPQPLKPSRKPDDPELWGIGGAAPPHRITTPQPDERPLWSKDCSVASMFCNLSLESLRSKREISARTLPIVGEDLWAEQAHPPELLQSTMGLWGKAEETEVPANIPERAPEHTRLLWTRDGLMPTVFASLPVESVRSKKDTSSVTLPVFSESLWKKKVVLPPKPELWRPTLTPTGLWDANSKTKTLAQMSIERKAEAVPLWRKEVARRTTNLMPTRTNTAVRLPDSTTLPKMSGNLWKSKTEVRQAPHLWVRRESMKIEKQPVGILLWARETTSNAMGGIPERKKISFIPPEDPLEVVSGSLWHSEPPEEPKGLWKRPVTTAPPTVLQPPVPLWSKEKASRRTTAVPERLAPAPRSTSGGNADLPKMSGSLWQPKTTTSPKGLWKEPVAPKVAPTVTPIMLWTAGSASLEADVVPARSAVPKHIVDEPLPIVSGEMWHKEVPGKPDGLWKRPAETVVICRKASGAPLWTKEGAARTTAAIPSRAPFVPKPASSRPLEPATGKLWHLEPPKKEPISLWKKRKPQAAALGIWNAEGTTPSLAEIKLQNEAKRDLLWQRRSVLAAKGGASEGVLSDRSSFIQKKPRKSPIFLETAQGELWKPADGSIDDDDTSWMITNTPPTDPLSRTSTFSDMSDLTPPTSAEDDFETHIRKHFSRSGTSPAGGLWQPSPDGFSSKKELGLWPTEAVSGSTVSLMGEDRPERIALPRQRAKPVEAFDSSHSLWQPEILCNSRVRSWTVIACT